MELTTYWDVDTTSNEASFHDISVAAQRLSSISENAPFANDHELTTLVAATTTEENFNNPNFPNLGSDDDDNADPVDAAVCQPVDDRKSAAKIYYDDVNVKDNEYDAVFDSREEKEDDDPNDNNYIDHNYEDDDDDEEDDEVVHTATSARAIDKLLSPNLAAFFANNENFEDNNDAMVNGDNDSSGLNNTFVRGGPKNPDVKNMTAAAAAFAMEHYQKERKAFTNRERCRRLKESEDNYNLSIGNNGCVSNKLRLMTEVAADHVVAGQNFPTTKIVSLRFAEEAIQALKHVVFGLSDVSKVTAKGPNFECTANKRDGLGWVVTDVFVNVCGKGISELNNAGRNVKPSSPLRATWLIDLLVEHIRSTPNLSNKSMRKLLQGYTTQYTLTNNLLQKVRSEGKAAIFGIPSLNVQYCHVLK